MTRDDGKNTVGYRAVDEARSPRGLQWRFWRLAERLCRPDPGHDGAETGLSGRAGNVGNVENVGQRARNGLAIFIGRVILVSGL